MSKQQGFTLIELVMVIVILGILAATALPKFAGLSKDAKVASLKGLKASMQTAAQMVNAKALINGNANNGTSTWTDMNNNGTKTKADGDVAVTYLYPTADANGLENLLDLDGFTRSGKNFRHNGTASCEVQYAHPTGTGQAPTYTVVSSGC